MKTERRRSPRIPHEGFLLLEVPTLSRSFLWPARVVDISDNGLAVSLPVKGVELRTGLPLYLFMVFQDRIRFDRVPAILVRQQGDFGAVQFQRWPEDDRERLLSLLQELRRHHIELPAWRSASPAC